MAWAQGHACLYFEVGKEGADIDRVILEIEEEDINIQRSTP